tara:strand:- start:413 stop:1057 length:645 start_codon:yes stop_codon:yes gene_type:complete
MVDLFFLDDSSFIPMSLTLVNLRFLDWEAISLSMELGEAICIRGESGSGKSLLLRAIADLIPHEGEVTLKGELRSSVSASDWRRRVGYLPAEILWWEDSVLDHFLEAPSGERLGALGLSSECMEWHPHRLSMGERQRLGLLRLLDRDPEVLLLDEPTANLDDETARRVETMILDYAKEANAELIWVTHSESQAERVGLKRYRMKDKQFRLEERG